MKKYLITGGAGFIGSNFIRYMLNNYNDIFCVNLDKLTYAGNLENIKSFENDSRYVFVQGDICDQDLVTNLFLKYDFDYIVNFAAESHVDRSILNSELFVKTNVLGTVNLLQVAKNFWFDSSINQWKRAKKFLQISTDEVYGSLGATGFFKESSPICPCNPYSSSKASADLFVKSFYNTYGLPINITRCSNNYGPYQFPEKLIPLIINNAINHKKLPVYGDGLHIRDWLFVEDHCRAIDLVINKGCIGEIYNIGGHNEYSNIAVIKTIIKFLHEKLNDDAINNDLIVNIEDRQGHDRRYGIDPQKLNDDLGWHPKINFEKGISLTIEWYLNNDKWLNNVITGVYQNYYNEMYKGKLN